MLYFLLATVCGRAGIPARDSVAWCHYIDQLIGEAHSVSGTGRDSGEAAMTSAPSYPCGEVQAGSIEAMICQDVELSTLDRQLAGIYAAASGKAVREHPPQLRVEQRGWIKGRNESFREHQGEVLISWGNAAPEMCCRKR